MVNGSMSCYRIIPRDTCKQSNKSFRLDWNPEKMILKTSLKQSKNYFLNTSCFFLKVILSTVDDVDSFYLVDFEKRDAFNCFIISCRRDSDAISQKKNQPKFHFHFRF